MNGKISWQLVVIIAMVIACVTTIEVLALYKGINGVITSITVAAIVGIPSVVITRKVCKPKE